jgi:hypothetical protein
VSIVVPVYKNGDKTHLGNYKGASFLSTTYQILSNILLSRLTPYAEEIIGDHQGELRRHRPTIDHIFCIRQIREKKMGIGRRSADYVNTMDGSIHNV